MGWTGMQPPYHGDKKLWIKQEMECNNEHGTWKIHDLTFRSNTAYGILEYTKKETGITKHIGMVVLCSFRADEWAYKEMSEDMHPYQYDAPKRMIEKLNQLGEPINENAKLWRDKCLEQKAKVSVPDGLTIRFTRPLDFRSFKEDTFKIQKEGRKTFFIAGNGMKCRITKWQDREYEVQNA